MREELFSDLRQVLRTLRKGGGATFVSALALAVGIGANTAVFSVADAVLLRPLPFREPDRLVMVWETKPAQSLQRERPSPGNFLDWRERCAAFEGLSLWHPSSATLRGDFDPEVIATAKVTPDFFRVLGVNAGLGNVFHAGLTGAVFNVAEQYRGGDRELVISDRPSSTALCCPACASCPASARPARSHRCRCRTSASTVRSGARTSPPFGAPARGGRADGHAGVLPHASHPAPRRPRAHGG